MTDYETKTFTYSEDGPGSYVIMATKLPEHISEDLRNCGLRGGMILYSRPVEGRREPTNNIHKFCDRFTASDDNSLLRLLRFVEKDNWEHLQDGMTYSPSFIEGLV